MMKLYWSPKSRSFSALWLMEETGQPYERVLTDISKGAQKTAEYRAINPMGKVPAIQDGDTTLAESAAICAYVAERYPQANLAPAPGDPLRAIRWPPAGAMRSASMTCSMQRFRRARGFSARNFQPPMS